MYKIILGLGLLNLTFNHPLLVGLAFVCIYLYENTSKEEKETIKRIIMSIYSNGREFSKYLVTKAAELGITVPELRKKIVIDLEIPEVEVKEEVANSPEIYTESEIPNEDDYYDNYQYYNPEVIVDQNSKIDELNRIIYDYETLLEEKGSKIASLLSKLQKAEAANYVNTEEEDIAFQLQCEEYIAEKEQSESLTKTTPGDSTWVKETIDACSADLTDEEKAILSDHEFIGDHIKKVITDLAIAPENTWIHGTLNDCFRIEDDECKIAPAGCREAFIKWNLSIDNWNKVFTPKAYRRLKAQLKAVGRGSDGSIVDIEEHNHAMVLLSGIEFHFAQEDFIEAMSRNQYNPNLVPQGVA
jgi:uncharacterized coiled-coil protein SlyX